MLDLGSSDLQFVRELMAELSLKIIDTVPLHHTASGDTWIDFLLTGECDSISEHSRSSPTFPSRHNIIFITINTFCPAPTVNIHTYRNIRKITSAYLCPALLEGDWSPLSFPANEMDIKG